MAMPYFPMYPADFEADTSHLTLEEDGAYNRLLRLMWLTPGCSIPDDEAWIIRRMRLDHVTFSRVVAPLIEEFLSRRNGRIFSDRLQREFKKADETSRKRSNAGKRGGRPQATENKGKDRKAGFDFDKAGLSYARGLPEPEPEPDKEKTDYALSARVSGRFDEWWNAYPHRDGKRGKKPAQAKYDRLVRGGVSEQTLIDGAIRSRGDKRVKDGYARDPLTWLNQAGWEDEPSAPQDQPSERRSEWRRLAG